MRCRLQNRRAVAAVEFGLLAALLFGLIFAIIGFASLAAAHYALAIGVEAAARYAVVHSEISADPATTSDIAQVFQAKAAPWLGPGVPVSISFTGDLGDTPGGTVVISATYNWSLPGFFVGGMVVPLAAQAAMTIQN